MSERTCPRIKGMNGVRVPRYCEKECVSFIYVFGAWHGHLIHSGPLRTVIFEIDERMNEEGRNKRLSNQMAGI